MTARAIYRIAYIRATARHPESAQRSSLAKLSPDRVIVDSRDGSQFESVARMVRKDDEVIVTHVHLLATSVEQIAARMIAVNRRGGAVVETSTGRRSDRIEDAILMIAGARHQIAGDKKVHSKSEARRKGKLGAEARGRWVDQFSATTLRDLRAIWRSRDYDSNVAALAAMDDRGGVVGWSIMLAWRAFGSSGRPGGRRRKSKT